MATVQRPPRSVDLDGQPIIGRRRPRPDSEAKVRGLLRYGADGPIPRMLHARPVLSPFLAPPPLPLLPQAASKAAAVTPAPVAAKPRRRVIRCSKSLDQ